jgi:hypothetical protein
MNGVDEDASINKVKCEVGVSGIKSCRFISGMIAPGRFPFARMLNDAHQFMMERSWQKKILDFWCGIMEPNLVGAFLYKIVPARDDVPPYHWVVIGPEIPHAYISIEDALNPACAIDSYASVMEDWILAVEEGRSLDEVYPVEVPAGMDAKVYAAKLAETLERIDRTVLERHRVDLGDRRK